MYRERLWTMRQYAGFGSAEDTNERFRYLLSQGQTALSVAFDLPTQLGYDSSHELASNEVGRVGVAIDTADDMAAVFDGLPLEDLSVNFTINATAPVILAFYIVAAERRGVDPARLAGTLQNDILKEFLARKLYVFPPQPSLQLAGDVVEYCARELPRFNPISITGYHAREAGCDAVQEIGLTMAAAIAYAEHFTARGLAFDSFAPRLSFHFSSQLDLFEEAAKVRAARGLWYEIATQRFGAANPALGPAALLLRLLRSHADRPAAAEQRGALHPAVPGRGAGRRPVHPRHGLRRGAGDPHGRVGPAGPAHPADHRPRIRGDQDRRPAGRARTSSSR